MVQAQYCSECSELRYNMLVRFLCSKMIYEWRNNLYNSNAAQEANPSENHFLSEDFSEVFLSWSVDFRWNSPDEYFT